MNRRRLGPHSSSVRGMPGGGRPSGRGGVPIAVADRQALTDRESKRFKDLGLAAAPPGDDRRVERLPAEPLLLRRPLVRTQNRLAVGLAEAQWKDRADT